MIINKKRIIKLNKILNIVEDNKFMVQHTTNDVNLLKEIGFINLEIGESVIPNNIGPMTKFNLNGKEKIAEPREKEIVKYTLPYSVTDWHGNHHSGTYRKKIQRYKRISIPAPLNEFTIIKKEGNDYTISSKLLSNNDNNDNNENIKNIINIMLEMFGTAVIVDENNQPFITTKRVQWKILPPGDYPWEIYSKEIKSKLKNVSNDELTEIKDRYNFLRSLNPKEMFSGEDGFLGYYIANFNDELYVCDSIYVNNAIYIFDKDWKELSKLTKKDIITNNLAKARIVHTSGWKDKLKGFIEK